MAIPRETNKELVVVVENDSVEVAISPPVLDSAIVVGQPPAVDPRTVYFSGFTDDVLQLKTASGLTFEVDQVAQPPAIIAEQVLVGYLTPVNNVVGAANNQIYISSSDRSIRIWSGSGSDWTNPQVMVGTDWPISGQQDDIFINTTTRSIRWFSE